MTASAGSAPQSPTPSPPPSPRPPVWAARRERGSLLALRFMAWLAVTAGRPATRLLLHPITLYFLVFGREASRHSRHYLRRALGRPVTWRDQYRHFHTFASTVLDRVYFVRNQLDVFDLSIRGDEGSEETINDRQANTASGQHGGFLLGAHLGSFESLHAAGKSYPGMRVTLVMYPENAKKIHHVLEALAPDFKLAIIVIGNPGSTLAIRDALDAGRLVGLLGDRHRGADSSRASTKSTGIALPFLGADAYFSDGPLRLAMLLKRRVLFMVGLFLGGRRYDVRFETLVDFRDPPQDPAAREALIRAALTDYVARLESLCREAPYNWFNFYDYWE